MRFFLSFFLFLLYFNFASAVSPENKLLQSANEHFGKGLYHEAKKEYIALLDLGFFSEKSLLKLAQSAEKDADYAWSIYAIKKLQIYYNTPLSDKKIKSLSTRLKLKKSDLPSGFQTITSNIRHSKMYVFWIIFSLSSAFFVGTLFLKKGAKRILLRYSSGSLVAILALSFIYLNIFASDFGQVVQESFGREQASFASDKTKITVNPGQMLKIHEKTDVWFLVSENGKRFWLHETAFKSF